MDISKIRFRLTLLYTVILASISIITAIILFASIWFSIETTNTRSLRTFAIQLGSAYTLEQTSQNEENFEAVLEALRDEDVTYTVYNDNLDVAVQSDNFPIDGETSLYLIRTFFSTRREEAEITDFSTSSNSFKICTDAYIDSSGTLTMVQLIKNMSSQRALLQGPMIVAILTIGLGVIISLLLGNYLARRSLEPIVDNYNRQQDFIGNASHELRTPLAVVMTNLEAAETDTHNPRQKQWIDAALSEVKRARDVIEDLLFLTRADSGESVVEIQPIDLSYLVLETSERLSFLAEKKQIKIITEISDSELFVEGDPKWVTELLTILIDNAIKYTNNNGKIRIELTNTESTVTVKIIDNGIGISAEDQAKIFDRFYRVDKARSREVGGTGLGLSIASLICRKLNITLSVQSEIGKGSTFMLVFKRI